MLGAGSTLVSQSGSNILINIFCGVTVNAAYGIANQVSSVIYSFVSNFQLAFQPQIVKLYAAGDKENQIALVNRASIISYFLLLIIFIPFIFKADYILGLWLKDVPIYTVQFCQWMLVYSLIDAIQAPLWMSITATGKIKVYSIWSSSLVILNLPIAWILLLLGYSPVLVFVARVIINLIAAIIRVLYIKSFLGFPIKSYLEMIIIRAFPITMVALVFSYYLNGLFSDSFFSFVMEVVCIVILICVIVFVLGLSANERQLVKQIVKTKLHKI